MKNSPYTNEQKQFLINNSCKYTRKQLVNIFNDYFDENRTIKSIDYILKELDVHCIPTINTWANIFTEDQKLFIRINGPYMYRKELKILFDKTFDTDINLNTIKAYCSRHNIKSPNGNGKFTKENNPKWQKGLSKEEFKSHYTNESYINLITNMIEANKVHHIGDIIIRHNKKYIIINNEYGKGIDHRIQEYDRYLWETKYGKIPDKYMIIHLDGNLLNCDLDNLICIPTKYRAFFYHNNWWSSSTEIKEIAAKWCELYYTLQEQNN